jgi:hypothetical protein
MTSQLMAISHNQYLAKHEAGFPDTVSYCDRCGHECGDYRIIGGKRICSDCEVEYLLEHATPDIVDSFIEDDPDRKYSFYTEIMDCFFSDEEKALVRQATVAVIKTMLKAFELPGEKGFLDAEKREYSTSQDDFYQYLEESL